ncbi:MAG: sugar-binding transcriptional regulator [Rubrobacteraceae bacterium]
MDQRHRSDLTEDGLLLLAEVAHLYYIKNLTQEHIAERIGVSRSNVSRMLKEARARGLVEIRVHAPLTAATDLQEELEERLGLRECLVLANPKIGTDANARTSRVGRMSALAARYLQENVPDGSILGVSWSSTVHHVVSTKYLQDKSSATAVQLMGSIGGSIVELDGVSITARLADVLGAKAHYLHAPMLVSDTLVRDGLLHDPHIRKTLEVARSADVMVVSVGIINRNSGQYRTGYLDDDDLNYIRAKGAVGDICGSYFARDGSPVELEMNGRTIAIEFEAMKAIPNRIGVSGGPDKALPNIGAVRAGLLNVLITDEDTAREMLDILNNEDFGQDFSSPPA